MEMTGCILPWMKQMHPKIQLCEDENETLKEAINEYLCAMNHITNHLFNATELEESCKEYDTLFPDCHSIRSCREVILEKQFKNSARYREDEEVVSSLWLFWSNPRIVYVEDFIGYDFHNFIGEVGGFFGLFLGFSFTSLFGLLEMIQKKWENQF